MTIVFLDLEETVIDDINSATILVERCEQIRKVLDHIQPDKLGILSWAIWNESERKAFLSSCTKDRIEIHLQRQFDHDLIWSMETVRDNIFKISGKQFFVEDFFDLFGKEECLNFLFRKHFFKADVVLIDDTVSHKHVTEFNGLRLVYLNAKLLG